MKKEGLYRWVWIFIGALIVIFSCSIVWADFYVVASGKKAKKTILISPKSTQTASGTALLNAVNGITDAGETNTYLVIIEPGIYDIGSNSLQMKEYVDIQGSGEKVTKITGRIDNQYAGVLLGANNTELRFLTVESKGIGGERSRAIYNSSASPKITSVTATASGASYNWGIVNSSSSPEIFNVTAAGEGGEQCGGIANDSSSPTMNNVIASGSDASIVSVGILNVFSSSPKIMNATVTASGVTSNAGIYNQNSSSPTILNSNINASGGTQNFGVYNEADITKINHSLITGSTYSVITASGSTTFVGGTMLNGGVPLGGFNKCVGAYDENYDPLFDNCTMSP